MAEQKLTALRSYEGSEGTVRRGDVFSVENKERADELKRLQLATDAPKDSEITNFTQKSRELKEMNKEDLVKVAEEEGVTVQEGALKEDYQRAILRNREIDYLNEQAGKTVVRGGTTQSMAAQPISGTAGSGAAGAGTTGGGTGTTGGSGSAGSGTGTGGSGTSGT